MRWFFLPGGLSDFYLFKARFSDPLVEHIFRVTERSISIKFACLLELVFQQIKDDQPSARSQNLVG